MMNQAVVLKRTTNPLRLILRIYLTIMFPLLVVLIAVRIVMTPAFLYFEYTRPGFPDDFYGLTQQDRLDYAPYLIAYLLNSEDITFLGNLTFPDGTSLFNTRELHHMHDVKIVTQYAFLFAMIAGILGLVAAFTLWRNKDTRHDLRLALMNGSMLTLGIIVTIVALAVLNWETFFVGFHEMFFESDTWYFAYSDTLIRLFPEQFWFDAALLVGTVSTFVAGITLFITWRWRRFDTIIG
jgi:integral membrane protein (TIGR01906 family)